MTYYRFTGTIYRVKGIIQHMACNNNNNRLLYWSVYDWKPNLTIRIKWPRDNSFLLSVYIFIFFFMYVFLIEILLRFYSAHSADTSFYVSTWWTCFTGLPLFTIHTFQWSNIQNTLGRYIKYIYTKLYYIPPPKTTMYPYEVLHKIFISWNNDDFQRVQVRRDF